MDDILVSISCLTYNHAPYIRQCIEGFLMQKTTFPFEILIHDDASTDGTQDIVKEYQKMYPEIIKPLYRSKNLYSQGCRGMNRFNYDRAKGKYIALCEGDDYWTDPLKLQKQVDFLEGNEEYSLCVSGFEQINTYTNEQKTIIKTPRGIKVEKGGYSFTLEDTLKRWITKTLTAMFKNNYTIFKQLEPYKHTRDIHLFYHILKTGKGFYFTETFGVYNIHEGGVNSMKYGKVNNFAAYNCYKELYELNKDKWTKKQYFKRIILLFNFVQYDRDEKYSFKFRVSLFKDAVFHISSIEDVYSIIKFSFSPQFRSKLKTCMKI